MAGLRPDSTGDVDDLILKADLALTRQGRRRGIRPIFLSELQSTGGPGPPHENDFARRSSDQVHLNFSVGQRQDQKVVRFEGSSAGIIRSAGWARPRLIPRRGAG